MTAMSKQSLENLNSNQGQNFDKFYALAQDKQLQIKEQHSNKSQVNATADRTLMQTFVEGRITEFDSLILKKDSLDETGDALNPYSDKLDRGSNQLMH